MKKLLLLFAVALALSMTAIAQGGGTTQKGAPGSTAAPAKPPATKAETSTAAAKKTTTMTGCLSQKPDGKFLLTNGRYKKGVEVSGPAPLKDHVGHTVKLTGTKTATTFIADSLQHISATCTTTATGGKKAKTDKAAPAKKPAKPAGQ